MFVAGATRLVWISKKYAVKVPRPSRWRLLLCGLLANMQEVEFSQAGWPELCPVLFSLPAGLLVVMPRCETLGRAMGSVEFEAFTKKQDYVVPVENKPDSFGWYEGQIVAIDYGS
jgi:hypothetical protein